MPAPLRRPPLFCRHQEAGARMVEFAGWILPVWFSSISEEHLCVRNFAGLFDVSHMGRYRIIGPRATDFLQLMTCNDVGKLKPGKAQYTAMLTESGGTVDDLILYKESETEYWAVVNAGNRQKDWNWMIDHLEGFGGTTLEDWSDAYAMLALQGPGALKVADSVFSPLPSSVPPFGHGIFDWDGRKVRIARTGYTGEDGIEVFVPSGRVELLWDQLLDLRLDGDRRVLPCGLGARDTLRLEASLPLYGHELNEDLSPLDIGFAWMVKLQKPDFVGKKALEVRIKEGRIRHLYALYAESGVPRAACPVHLRSADGSPQEFIGHISSGTFSPYLKKGIAMVISEKMLPPDTQVLFQVRDTYYPGILKHPPFIRRQKNEHSRILEI
ncbi:MAG: glycine cleavage system aminomethyltransferase GcvT [bacterium JZ-2024 1]